MSTVEYDERDRRGWWGWRRGATGGSLGRKRCVRVRCVKMSKSRYRKNLSEMQWNQR